MTYRSCACLAVLSTLSGCVYDGAEVEPTSDEQALTIIPRVPAPWQSSAGLSAAQFGTEFNKWFEQGYRLTDLSAYNVNGAIKYAGIWEKKSGPAQWVLIDMTDAEYQNQFTELGKQGFRLKLVEGFEKDGQPHYAAIWEQTSGPPLVAFHGMSASTYSAEKIALAHDGYRLSWVQGYAVNGVESYAAMWEQKTGPDQFTQQGLNRANYESLLDLMGQQGFRLVQVSAYTVGSNDLYAGIWEKSSVKGWITHHRMPVRDYQHQFTDLLLQGYRLKQVDGYALSKADRYVAIWEAEPTSLGQTYCKDSQCFDLKTLSDQLTAAIDPQAVKWGFEVRRGTSVFQVAAGPGRTAADPPLTGFSVFDRFNGASVSKTVTAVATLQALRDHGISIYTPVWPWLPPDWHLPLINQHITFWDLLRHMSGLRSGAVTYDDLHDLLEQSIDSNDYKVRKYQNCNYALLRILVASLDGYTNWDDGDGSAARFIQYVNRKIFAPIGIYDVAYQATGSAPTLFYPNPPGNAEGTDYGDWSLKPGSAGAHLSIHELADFAAATFGGLLLASQDLADMKAQGYGFESLGTYVDGTQCWGKAGGFPGGDKNGGAALSTEIVACDNGVIAMLMANGGDAKSAFLSAMPLAFTAQP